MSDAATPREVVLVRWGEIFLKGDNRGFFERALVDNVRRSVAAIPGVTIQRMHGRLVVRAGEGGARPVTRALERVFGIVSVSPARVVPRELDAISAAAIEVARIEAAKHVQPTFKVESRRSDKRFPMNSMEVSRDVGAAVIGALALPVDVHHPRFTVGVEIGYEDAFVFAEVLPGPGGLPTGVTGRVELLLSGGIDSPVAGWMLLKRGCSLGATYFHSFPYTGEKTQDKVERLGRQLAAWQLQPMRLSVVPFTDVQKQLRDASGDGRLAVVLYRRMMMRIAERIAYRAGAKALATGEALAQVASQTLENLSVIGASTRMTILRPCLGHDKHETITLARRIGSYETSIEPYDDCCSLFVPEHPETKAKLAVVESMESRLNIPAMVEDCFARTTNVTCEPR
ncbi:MAG: putative tRNA sulfurtransferase [Myxococcales bacterium]|nr:putative tRNA sulfurtransferase [Myxococcales bacterium]